MEDDRTGKDSTGTHEPNIVLSAKCNSPGQVPISLSVHIDQRNSEITRLARRVTENVDGDTASPTVNLHSRQRDNYQCHNNAGCFISDNSNSGNIELLTTGASTRSSCQIGGDSNGCLGVGDVCHRSLNLLHWNINGVRGCTAMLEEVLARHRVNICLLQETRYPEEFTFTMRGYRIFSVAPTGRGRGLLTLVRTMFLLLTMLPQFFVEKMLKH